MSDTTAETVKTFQGKISGKTIELDVDPGIEKGSDVEVHIRAIPVAADWGEGLRRSAGSMAEEWTDEDDRIFEQIYQDRKRDTRRELPD
ncbi:MAG TPA: hypothetical protein VF306_23060 [Pirellulales bacterium]